MRNITKRFGSVVANDRAWLDIRHGEILSLLGENGSGKTTLMNMLSGIYFPDEGQIFVNEKEVSIRSPKDAFDLGIGMIHQHFKLVEVLTAAENVILGLKEGHIIDLPGVKARIKAICDKYGFVVDPDRKVYDMSVSEKQTLEIVKVLYRGADVLILDEPTAVLTPQETKKLFAVMRNMKADGKAVVIITHKLNEVMEVADRVAILRKGYFVGDMLIKDTNPQEMTNMMMGHAVTLNIDRPEPVNPKPRLVVQGLTVVDRDGVKRLDNVGFTANTGEILGIAGVSGSGQKELLEAIAGLQKSESGTVKYIEDNGTEEELVGRDPLEIASMGVSLSFVPEDRLGMGLVGSMDITDNMLLRSFRRGHHFFADRKAPRNLAARVVKELEVNTPGLSTPVSKLSGGNVQKVLVGREIADEPTVLMTAYAVRGLDINSSYTIYDLINQQKKKGVAVIFVGEDLDVLLELCDRILVMCSGCVSGIVDARSTTKEEVGMLMTSLNGGAVDEQ
jgi:general nucleoside transport system ATP-binding protein